MRSPHLLNLESVYGPVESRRYGLTLGINPFAGGEKVCTFNCAYCQLGWTPANAEKPAHFVEPDAIRSELVGRARDHHGQKIDAIVLCGNGEPTLHPCFPDLMASIMAARDLAWPMTPVVLLTHGGRLTDRQIFEAASWAEECSVKLDAGSYESLRRVNMPREEVDLELLVDRIRALPNSVVQSCFIEGAVTNADDESLRSWLGAIRCARPQRVDIYTISRTPPSSKVGPVDAHRLHQIGALAARAVHTKIRVFPSDHLAD